MLPPHSRDRTIDDGRRNAFQHRDPRNSVRRKRRELNPQGVLNARPTSNRLPSPFGWLFRSNNVNRRLGSGRRSHRPFIPFEIISGRQGIRTLIPQSGRVALAAQPGQPYPAAFRYSVDRHLAWSSSTTLIEAVIALTEVGVEPTNSPGSRPGRFSSLRTRPITSIAGPGNDPG